MFKHLNFPVAPKPTTHLISQTKDARLNRDKDQHTATKCPIITAITILTTAAMSTSSTKTQKQDPTSGNPRKSSEDTIQDKVESMKKK